MLVSLVPGWVRGYRASWLGADLIAGVVIGSVVVPQAVAYAQIAGLPPQAGLMAAPGALIAYALIGTSRSLVVSATTATSAVSAAAVAPLAGGDTAHFAALSAGLAVVTAVVLVAAGLLRLGAVADLVSKPVMTGFLFGLGLTIMIGQLPAILGVEAGDGEFFDRLWALLGDLGDIDPATFAVGAGSIAVLVAGRRWAPGVPATLLVLALAIAVSALFDLAGHGVAVVGDLPDALPDPSVPDISLDEALQLVGASLGVLLVSAEAIGVARSLATRDGYEVDANRDLVALGASNLLAGLSQGFVQSGGGSQTAAADRAGGKSQLATLVAAGLVLLTGAFLAPLFADLPEATLAAIVITAVSGFLQPAELARFARIRRSAIAFAAIALAAVLLLGVLQGLIVAAGLSLVYVIRRLSRPSIGALARDPATGVWGRADRHPAWELPAGALVVGSDGPLLYANVHDAKQHVLDLFAAADPAPARLVLDLGNSSDLDVETLDAFGELAAAIGGELWLAAVHVRPARLLHRAGLDDRVRIAPTLDDAVRGARITPAG